MPLMSPDDNPRRASGPFWLQLIIPFIALTLITPNWNTNHVQAKSDAELATALVESEKLRLHNDRVAKVQAFLTLYNSPMLGEAETFVTVAENNNIDWRLLPAIACKESGCGNQVPYSYSGGNSYNPFGWGVYGNHVTSFASWNEAINVVGKAMSEKYYAKGLVTPEQIENVYTPSSIARGRTWSKGVRNSFAQMNSALNIAEK